MSKLVSLVLYDDKYKEELEGLLLKFSKEVFGYGTASIDEFVNRQWCIYLALRDDKVIGFASFIYNTYFGLRPPTVGLTYVYVLPEHRNTRAVYLLGIQAGVLSVDNKLPLESYYASEDSFRISRKLQGKKIYDTYIYEVDEVEKTFTRLINKLKIKDRQ